MEEPDQDALLALELHRQMNAPQRRNRRNPYADKTLKQISESDESSEATSGSEAEEDQGNAKADQVPRDKSKGAKKAKRPRYRPLEPHEVAAKSAVTKAAKAYRSKGSGAAGRNHCKCFLAGIPWGVLLPREALKTRHELATALTRSFERDGIACQPNELDITVIATTRDVVHFPPSGAEKKKEQEESKESNDESSWEEAVKTAQRVYVAIVSASSKEAGVAAPAPAKEAIKKEAEAAA